MGGGRQAGSRHYSKGAIQRLASMLQSASPTMKRRRRPDARWRSSSEKCAPRRRAPRRRRRRERSGTPAASARGSLGSKRRTRGSSPPRRASLALRGAAPAAQAKASRCDTVRTRWPRNSAAPRCRARAATPSPATRDPRAGSAASDGRQASSGVRGGSWCRPRHAVQGQLRRAPKPPAQRGGKSHRSPWRRRGCAGSGERLCSAGSCSTKATSSSRHRSRHSRSSRFGRSPHRQAAQRCAQWSSARPALLT